MWILDELKKRSKSGEIALIHREERITFRQLWETSDALAAWMKEKCKTKAPVVIYGNKEIEITVVMLAALKTGRAYVPLDITFPPSRVETIMQDVENELLFNFSGEEVEFPAECIEIKKDEFPSVLEQTGYKGEGAELQTGSKISEDEYIKADDNCYILFTSGSTGKPKGVQITRKNIENFTSWFASSCELSEGKQVVLNQVSYSFDVSVIPLYIYLPMGKTLFSIDKEMLDNTRLLFEYLEGSRIAAWVSTPAFLEICSFADQFQEEMLPELETIILAGEVLTKKLVLTLHNKFKRAKVINGYGPTEGTVLLSACEITDTMLRDEKSLPIGRILDDGEYQILDEKGEAVLDGGIGELVVVSDSISKGYFKNPEQTKKVFFPTESGKMGYHTGDLVFEQDGLLYYVARKDTQVKLNGFRIELNDISSNLNELAMVNNSVVLPVYKEGRVSYLTAFIVLNERPEMSDLKIGIELKKELKEKVPSYMVPRKIIILDRFPMNINGKIDRKKLAEEYL